MEEAGHIGLHPDALGIHAHEQVVHGGVGAHTQPENAPGIDSGGLAQVCQNGHQRLLQNGILELLFAAGLTLLNDSVDDVRAVADLAVAGGTLGQQLAGSQIRQHHGHGGGTDIDGAADNIGVVRGADLHTLEGIPLLFALDADAEIVLPEGMGQLHHHREGNAHMLHAQCILDGPGQPLVVRHGILQGGLCQRQHLSQAGIFEVNAAVLQVLLALVKNRHFLGAAQVGGLHPGLVGAGNVRHENGAVGNDLGGAGQPPALLVLVIADMPGGHGFQLALHQLDTALTAGAVAGAGCVNGHIGAASQLQKVVADIALDGNRLAAFDLEYDLWHKDKPLSFWAMPCHPVKLTGIPRQKNCTA